MHASTWNGVISPVMVQMYETLVTREKRGSVFRKFFNHIDTLGDIVARSVEVGGWHQEDSRGRGPYPFSRKRARSLRKASDICQEQIFQFHLIVFLFEPVGFSSRRRVPTMRYSIQNNDTDIFGLWIGLIHGILYPLRRQVHTKWLAPFISTPDAHLENAALIRMVEPIGFPPEWLACNDDLAQFLFHDDSSSFISAIAGFLLPASCQPSRAKRTDSEQQRCDEM